jgi:DNA-binding LacI/PurR family transcriptional regulator
MMGATTMATRPPSLRPRSASSAGVPAERAIPLTMRQLAERLGVSQPVVSKALFGGRTSVRVSDERGAAIRRAARELGYRPNAAARSLSRRRFASVTLVQYVYRNWSYLPQVLLEALLDALDDQGLAMAVQHCEHEDLDRVDSAPRLLREADADGLLINLNYDLGSELRERFVAQGVPAIWINADTGSDCVLPDDRRAARELTQALLKAGHRRVRYLGLGIDPQENHFSKAERPAGYADAMHAAGLVPEMILIPSGSDRALAHTRIAEARNDGGEAGVWIAYSQVEWDALIRHAMTSGTGSDLRCATFMTQAMELDPFRCALAIEPHASLAQTAVSALMTKMKHPERRLSPTRVAWTIHS